MKKKNPQYIMVWLLPIILIGGVFFKILGYLVFLMMLFFLALSYFRGRLWCSRFCPRGAFLDLFLKRFSFRKKLPKIFFNHKFKGLFFTLFMVFFMFQLIISPKDIYSIGFVFIRMCIITTIISVLLGIPLIERAWCAICPMGMLQNKINSLKLAEHSLKFRGIIA
jgi:polyferredoxin